MVLHLQLAVTRTSLRRGFRMVSSATFFTSSQQSTRAYRLLVGLAGSMIYAFFRRLKCQKRKYTMNKILLRKKICAIAIFFVKGLWRIRPNASEGGEGKRTFVEILCRFIDVRDAYVVENVKSRSLIPTVVKQFETLHECTCLESNPFCSNLPKKHEDFGDSLEPP